MNITNSNIEFKGNFIEKTVIKKLQGRTYKPCEAYIVALTREDLPVLEKTAQKWNALYSNQINKRAEETLRPVNLNSDIFALTTQNGNFKHLDPDKIQGLCEFEKKICYNEINFLQINPKHAYKEKNYLEKLIEYFRKSKRQYEEIGTKIINALKRQSENKRIKVYADENSIGFYKKNGFVQETENSMHDLVYKNKTN